MSHWNFLWPKGNLIVLGVGVYVFGPLAPALFPANCFLLPFSGCVRCPIGVSLWPGGVLIVLGAGVGGVGRCLSFWSVGPGFVFC